MGTRRLARAVQLVAAGLVLASVGALLLSVEDGAGVGRALLGLAAVAGAGGLVQAARAEGSTTQTPAPAPVPAPARRSPRSLPSTTRELVEALEAVRQERQPQPVDISGGALSPLGGLLHAHRDGSGDLPEWVVALEPAELVTLALELPGAEERHLLHTVGSLIDPSLRSAVLRGIGDRMVGVLSDERIDPAAAQLVWRLWKDLDPRSREAATTSRSPYVRIVAAHAVLSPSPLSPPGGRALRLLSELGPQQWEVYVGLLEDDLAAGRDPDDERYAELAQGARRL